MVGPSKGQTLQRLASAAPQPFVVDPFVLVRAGEWKERPEAILGRVREAGLGPVLIVRSSAAAEDADSAVPPGLFQTTSGVRADDASALLEAIGRVVASYEKHPEVASQMDANAVIIQTQVVLPLMSGVAQFIESSAYLHIDYDDESATTDRVTAGHSSKSVDALTDRAFALPEPWSTVRDAVLAVSEVCGIRSGLVEFALTRDGVVHVFQARSHLLGAATHLSARSTKALRRAIDELNGAQSFWSEMADWNPAELIGGRPEPLALSLFCSLITDRAWLEGRSSLGYRAIEPARLVDAIAGKPYVNVRSSLLSFTPASLPLALSERLVTDRLDFLRTKPWLHDKVESEVMFTAADVGRPPRTEVLRTRGFDARDVAEIEESLRALTERLVAEQRGWAASDVALRGRLTPHESHGRLGCEVLAAKILEDVRKCRELGVVPFARHARLAFVARDLLARLQQRGAISAEWERTWWAGVRTVVHDVVEAIKRVAQGDISRADFNDRVGHLRARTFDICSPRYDSEASLPKLGIAQTAPSDGPEPPSQALLNGIHAAFRDAKLEIDPKAFLDFAEESTQLRESLKFSFTRLLSNILEDVAHLGQVCGLSREEMAFSSLDDIAELATGSARRKDREARLRDVVGGRREEWLDLQSVVLPDLVLASTDLVVVETRLAHPNFITTMTSEGAVAIVKGAWGGVDAALDGRIVLIEAADPGFDWIFAFRLAGLVTMYGGATSHMAIRCAQLQVPAAIGCGVILFDRVAAARRVRLDCATKKIVLLTPDATDV